MQRDPYASTSIASIGYDEPSQTLEIEFISGTVYQYYNVNKNIYDALMAAPSKGKFFAHQIRSAFPYSRVG